MLVLLLFFFTGGGRENEKLYSSTINYIFFEISLLYNLGPLGLRSACLIRALKLKGKRTEVWRDLYIFVVCFDTLGKCINVGLTEC